NDRPDAERARSDSAVQHGARVPAVDDVGLYCPREPRKLQRRSRIQTVPAHYRVQRHARRFELSNQRTPLRVEPADNRRKTSPIELGDDRSQAARLPTEPQAVDDVENGLRQTSTHTS